MKISEMNIELGTTKIRAKMWNNEKFYIIPLCVGNLVLFCRDENNFEVTFNVLTEWEYFKGKESPVLKMSVKEIMNDYLWKPKNNDSYNYKRMKGYDTCNKKFLFVKLEHTIKELSENFEYEKLEDL